MALSNIPWSQEKIYIWLAVCNKAHNRCSGIFFSLMCLLTVKEKPFLGTFPEVQWLRFCASNAWDSGLIPGQRNKIPHA